MSGSSSTTKIFFCLLCILALHPYISMLQRGSSLPLLYERQRKMKRCAFAFLTLHPYLSAVSLDNLTGDVEANAQPRIGFFFGVSDLVEPLKNLVLTLFGNPNPKILD